MEGEGHGELTNQISVAYLSLITSIVHTQLGQCGQTMPAEDQVKVTKVSILADMNCYLADKVKYTQHKAQSQISACGTLPSFHSAKSHSCQ